MYIIEYIQVAWEYKCIKLCALKINHGCILFSYQKEKVHYSNQQSLGQWGNTQPEEWTWVKLSMLFHHLWFDYQIYTMGFCFCDRTTVALEIIIIIKFNITKLVKLYYDLTDCIPNISDWYVAMPFFSCGTKNIIWESFDQYIVCINVGHNITITWKYILINKITKKVLQYLKD